MAAIEKRPEIIKLSRGLTGVPLCEDYERMISGMMYALVANKHNDAARSINVFSGTIPTCRSC
jgi:hypothetical protein